MPIDIYLDVVPVC